MARPWIAAWLVVSLALDLIQPAAAQYLQDYYQQRVVNAQGRSEDALF
jgi:hypothetical protein